MMRNEGPWISVEERMPPTDHNVAILISADNVAIYNWPTCAYRRVNFDGTPHEETVWWAGVPGKYQRLPADGWIVTHWAELPKLPSRTDGVLGDRLPEHQDARRDGRS